MRNSITKKQSFGFCLLSWAALSVAVMGPSRMGMAQESLAGMSAASGISSSMSGMSNSGAMTAGSRMRGSMSGMGDGMSGEFGEMPSPSMGGMGPGMAPPRPMQPRLFGTQRGVTYLNELLNARRTMPKIPSPIGRSRSSRGQAALSRRLKNMTSAQRQRLVMSKYDIRPRNWLAHYLKTDRYKIASGLWSYMTTRTSRFYYRPWAPAMLKADPNHVIGFRTWHDALLAGYRPDPVSRPEPAPQIVDMARYTKGTALQRYIEFVYAGQVSPSVFTRNYSYVKRVAGILQRYRHTRPLVGETIEKVILASLGEGTIPNSVGGPPAPPPMLMGGPMSGFGGSFPGGSSPGNEEDKRAEQFNNFSNRAGSMANVPANSGSGSNPPIDRGTN